ncbi:aminoacyltransferase [Streptococcus suis]|uniref:aminoacyltransferase n=1 Tax=Streptococcus suis TaxID=1307 RepID=UPI001C98506C|nr:aminoacyltransferase [Streptococcus suis]MBY4956166.1 aminoacyltransferase [Streptococcus suis]MBY5017827.1 aminoacyltransferase [Streptococcus suis]
MTFCQITKEEFLKHCEQVNEKSFFQSIEMAGLLSKRGYDVRYAGFKNSQSEIVISTLLFCKKMAGGLYMELNSGPLVTDDAYLEEFYQSLKNYAKREGVLELVVKPSQVYQLFDSVGNPISEANTQLIEKMVQVGFKHDGLQTGYPNGEPVWHYVKDLEGITEDTLVSSFSKKGKVLSKKANSFGLKITRLTKDELPRFKAITETTSNRRDYTDKPLEYYQDLFDTFSDGADFLIASLNLTTYLDLLHSQEDKLKKIAENLVQDLSINPKSRKKGNELREIESQIESFEQRKQNAEHWINKYGTSDIDIAASLFIYTKQELVYLFSGSLEEFSSFYAPIVLQEFAMKKAIKKSIKFYNFLGITGLFDGSDGVLRFKQNFNGYILRKAGTFRYYPHPIKHKIIQIIKKIVK